MLDFWGVRYIVELMMTKTIGFSGIFQVTKPSNLDFGVAGKINMLNPKSWGWKLDVFPFLLVIFRFQQFIFRGVVFVVELMTMEKTIHTSRIVEGVAFC